MTRGQAHTGEQHAGDMGHAHGHGHSHVDASALNERRLVGVLCLIGVYMLVEVGGGLFSGSLALVADAGHMLADVLGLTMTISAIRFARRPATPAKTYGFYRTEILAAVANSVLLFAIAAYILYEAWQRFHGSPDIESVPMLLVALGGLAVNFASVKVLHAGAGESLNVRGAFLEVLSDLLGSAGTVLAALVILLTGWWPADPLVSVLVALFILPRTWSLLKGALDVLLEATPGHLDLAQIEQAMRQVPGVLAVHDLHVWTITSGFVALTGHVTADHRPSGDVLHDLQALLHDSFEIEHATLQVEQCEHADEGACCAADPRCFIPSGTPVANVVMAAGEGGVTATAAH